MGVLVGVWSDVEMIRAFITPWEFIAADMRVTNPILEQGDGIVTGSFTCSMFYPDANLDGLPDGPHVLVLVESQSQTIEQLDTLAGVYMFPPYPFDTLLADMPQSVKDGVVGLCELEGWMPTEPLYTQAVTYGDCLKLMANHFQSGFISFGAYEIAKAAEFG